MRRALIVHAGRIATYATLGASVAALSASTINVLRNGWLHTAWLLLPNFLLLLSALYLLGFQQAVAPAERAGHALWRSLAGVRERSASWRGTGADLLCGAIWGLAPCGMIYSALGLAVLAAHPLDGALVMAAFGVATLPVLLTLGVLSERTASRLRQPQVRRALGVALLVLVAWNMVLLPGRLNGVHHAFWC